MRSTQLLDAPQAALGSCAPGLAAEPVVAELEALALERTEIGSARAPGCNRWTGAATARSHGVGRTRAREPHLRAAAGTPALSLPPALINQLWTPESGRETYLLAVGPGEDMSELDAALAARKVHRVAIPADLPQDPGELRTNLQQRRTALDTRESSARAALARLDAEHAVPAALGEVALAAWVVTHAPGTPGDGALRLDHRLVRGARRLRTARGTRPARPALPAANDGRAGWDESLRPSCATRAGHVRSKP